MLWLCAAWMWLNDLIVCKFSEFTLCIYEMVGEWCWLMLRAWHELIWWNLGCTVTSLFMLLPTILPVGGVHCVTRLTIVCPLTRVLRDVIDVNETCYKYSPRECALQGQKWRSRHISHNSKVESQRESLETAVLHIAHNTAVNGITKLKLNDVLPKSISIAISAGRGVHVWHRSSVDETC